MKRKFKLILGLLVIALLIPAVAFSGESPAVSSDCGKLTEIDKAVIQLKNAARKDPGVSLVTIGASSVKKEPIYMVVLSKKAGKGDSPRLRVMVTARIHGSEPAGMEALLEFIDDYVNHRGTARSYVDSMDLYLIPCVNPGGSRKALENYRRTGGFWDRTGRRNLLDMDMNRDFHAARSQEVRALIHLFNRVRPQAVIDLHEYSSMPLLTGGAGWWRAATFDVLIGAGRLPDVYGPLAAMATDTARKDVFATLNKNGYRGDFYAVSGGSIDSTSRMGVTGADYFNLRNAFTILVETAGYDRGEATLGKRSKLQRMVLDKILERLSRERQKLIDITDRARQHSKHRTFVTMRLHKAPRTVVIEGRPVTSHKFSTTISVEGRKYLSEKLVQFTCGDTAKPTRVKMPLYYVLFTTDPGLLRNLLLHRIAVYQVPEPIVAGNMTIPRGAFLIPREQESSALVGFILDERARSHNRYSLSKQSLVYPCNVPLDLDKTRKIETSHQAEQGVKTLVRYLFNVKGATRR